MSERSSRSAESRTHGDRLLGFIEGWNKVSATVLAGAGVIAVATGSPEVGVFLGGLAAIDVATGGLVKAIRNRPKKSMAT